MARITVEDCLDNVDNRFQLVLAASKRARQIAQGAEPLVPRENDKPTVVALREIAEGLVTGSILNEEKPEQTELIEEQLTVNESISLTIVDPNSNINDQAQQPAPTQATLTDNVIDISTSRPPEG